MSPRLVALLLAATLTTPVGAANLFCCQDSGSGRRVCGDVLPSQCRGLAYKIIDGQGNVVREVAAPLNAEQRAQKESAERKRKEYEEMQREQRRRDAALLDLYNRPEDIDKARTRAEEEVNYEIRQAEKRIAEARKRRQKFADEAEFYKKKDLPAEVVKGLKDADYELQAQQSLLETKQRDLENVRARFAEDKRRYLDMLSGRASVGVHPAAATAGKSPASRQ